MQYSFDGIYTMTGDRRIQTAVIFEDLTVPETLFHNAQVSETTPNESFTLGLQEGDKINTLSGNISGTLTPGHLYSLNYNYLIQRFGNSGGGASSQGNFNLNLMPVPAPGAALLAMMGFGLVGWVRKRPV